MVEHDICDEVIFFLQAEGESYDNWEKLYRLLILFETAWEFEFLEYEQEDKMLENLPYEEPNNERNLDYLVERINVNFKESREMRLFVKASKKMFLTYANSGKMIQLKNKIYGKNRRFMEQFVKIKSQIHFE